MKIVITDAKTVTNGDLSLSCLSDFGEVVCYELTPPEALLNRLKDADALLCNKTPITRALMKACPKLRYIGLFATGYNNIDVEAAKEYGITVCNAGSYSTDSVAQQVFAFILHHTTQVAAYNDFVQEGNWIRAATFSPFVFSMSELAGKTMGIFGFGNIGKKVATLASAFGMKVLVTTRTEREEDRLNFGIEYVNFDELLARSDFLSVHTPLTEATRGLFDEKAFSQMKPGCFFINTSRGGVLDEKALIDAVQNGPLSGAGIDVLSVEPMQADCPLLGIENIILTPHVAWAPLETRQRLLSIVYHNLKAYLEGNPIHVVS